MKVKPQKIFLPQTIFIGLLIILITNSCRKIDSISVSDYATTSRFFQANGNIKPIVNRIIEKIKRDNERHPFVPSMAQNSGFAVWDKAIIQTKPNTPAKGFQNRDMSGDDTIVLIPMVLENTDFVSSLLKVKISDDIFIKLFEGKDYQQYFDPNKPMTADEYVKVFMKLDYAVFNYTKFKILDFNLFKDKIPDSVESQISRAAYWVPADGPLGDYCGSWLYGGPEATQYNWYSDDMTCDFGDLSDGGGDSGSSGGSGGNNGNGNNGGYNNGSGSSGGSQNGNGNNGYTPVRNKDTFPNNRCLVVDSLMKTNDFPMYYKALRDSVKINHEIGILFENPFSPSPNFAVINGDTGTLSLDMNPGVPINGSVHSHYNDSNRLSVFSSDDFFKLYDWYKNGKVKDTTTFTFGMVSDSTAYILMITDFSKFDDFGNAYLSDSTTFNLFENIFYNGYGIDAKKTVSQNEKAFLSALKLLKSGLSVFRGDSNLNHFTKIGLDANNNVSSVPCANDAAQ